jgi:anti-anti-sigma factor
VRREREGLRLFGEVDLATCPTLVEALDTVIVQPAGDVILDCSAVTFFGAAGVSALIRAGNELDRSRRRLVIRNPSSIVRRVLGLFDLAELFADAPNRAANSTPGE